MAVSTSSYGEPMETPTAGAPMPSDSRLIPNSPEWWVKRLEAKLTTRAMQIRGYEDYYEGVHKLAFATEQFRKAFNGVFQVFADNFMQIVVDSVDERLHVQGFRIPMEADTEALLTGDKQAWEFWQANGLDSGSQMVHTDALVDSMSYVIVGPDGDIPRITGESALQVIVERTAGSRRRLAALKRWRDEDGFVFATLYLPDEVYKFVSEKRQEIDSSEVRYKPRQVPGETYPLRNPLGIVPVVPFPNRPRLVVEGRSEIGQLIPLQNAINKLFMDMLVASEFAGFPQRVATGIELPEDPETHQPITDVLKMSIDRFLHTASPDAKFGVLDAAELGNYTNAIAMAIQHVATRSSTPPHYFLAHGGNFPSGESLKAAETGLVAKVRRRQRSFGEAWEEVMRLAFLTAGEEGKAQAALGGEVIWGDPESRTESEHIDALTKLASLGVPNEVLWEKSGMFSPQEIGRMKDLIAQQAAEMQVSPVQLTMNPGAPKVEAPVTVNVPGRGPVTKTVIRDAKGNITGTQETPTKG